MKSYFHSLIPFLSLFCSCQFRRLDPIQFQAPMLMSRQAGLSNSALFDSTTSVLSCFMSWVEFYITTDGQPASLSWNKAPFWGLLPDLYYCLTVAGLLIWGALSDERTGLSFIIAAGTRQRSHFGSESRRTLGHILLSQIRDFPFRRLLRLAGSRSYR
jgi:hypothetical protein